MHKIYIHTSLFYHPHHKTHTNLWYKVNLYQKSTHIDTDTNTQYMVPFAVERNVNKGKDAVLNPNCIKVTNTYCSAVIIL